VKKFSRMALLTVLAVALVAFAAGCGDDSNSDSSSSSGTPTATDQAASTAAETTASDDAGGSALDQATADVEKLSQRPTKIGLTTPLEEGKPVPSGKLIYFLGCGLPVCKGIGDHFNDAAKVFGWKTKYVNAGLTPETIKGAWDLAVRDKPDGVMVNTGGVPKDVYADELAALKKANIPVVFNSEVFPANEAEGVTAVVGGPARQTAAADAMAEWAAVKTEGKGDILFVTSSALGNQKATADQFVETYLPKYCPDCKVTVYDAPITSVGKDLPNKIAQQVQKHSGINLLIVQGGDFAIGLPAALAGASLEGKFKILIQSQSATASQDLKNGKYDAIYGLGLPELVWLAADGFARFYSGQSLKPTEEADGFKEWFIQPDQVPADTEDYPLVADYQAQYKALWGK